MSSYIGFDTSNYRTSVGCIHDDGTYSSFTKLIPVREGSIGIRQSDAVFHHTKQLFPLLEKAFETTKDYKAVGVSVKPRPVEGSYMPCFLVGSSHAYTLAQALNLPIYEFSHQEGHIMAALKGSESLNLLGKSFYAWHVSGGTTECHLCEPDERGLFSLKLVSSSLDLKAGQAVDRVGRMLGLPFPAGPYLEEEALKSSDLPKVKASFKNLDFSLSGLENQCRKLLDSKADNAFIAKYCMSYISETIAVATKRIFKEFGKLPIVCSGGVMSNQMLQNRMKESFDAYVCPAELSGDNAVGIALLAKYCEELN